MKKSLYGMASLLLASQLHAEVLDIGTLGGTYSFARDINQKSQVAGEAKTAKGLTHAFLWENGAMKDLGTLAGQAFSMANGLNNLGEVVGYGRSSATTGQTKALLWDANGKIQALPNLSGQSYAQASDLNDKGEIAGVSGTKAVVWKNKKAKALPSLGGDYSIALGINNSSWIIGNSLTKTGEVHATLWQDGKAVDLGTLGGRFSTANAINDRNQIVGSSEGKDGEVHAFLWENGEMKDLGPGMIRNISAHSLLAGESPEDALNEASSALIWSASYASSRLEELPGASYSSAFGINDEGISVGVTELKLSDEAQAGAAGEFHATVWLP